LLESGQILGLDGLTGEIRWSAESRIAMWPEPPELFYDERGIYALSKNGASGFAEDGRLLWHLDLRDASSIPGFGDDGILYSGGTDWILYAFGLEEQVGQGPRLAHSPSPEGSYGTGTPPPSSWARNPMRYDESPVEGQLGIIGRDIERGRVGDWELEYTAYLMELIDAGQDPETSRYSPLIHINHRVRALQLLARIGSRETIPFLARIFSEDRDPNVKAAAAQAIGVIGMDNNGIALQAFNAAAFSPNQREERVLTAIAAATGAICRFSGPPSLDSGVRILVSLSSPNRPQVVRNLAKQELESLNK
ncbi:MAG: HEAT repeat domain-containing protein, partial [Treponema sp.]|nr:HEAT repeat domain-containing protein [Treponema sp.]